MAKIKLNAGETTLGIEAFPAAADSEKRLAFIEGLRFGVWLVNATMTHEKVPLYIKYRMYKNQQEAKGIL